MICRSKIDEVQVDRLANRPTMKTASTSIDIVTGTCQRKECIYMNNEDLEATNMNPTPDLFSARSRRQLWDVSNSASNLLFIEAKSNFIISMSSKTEVIA